MQARYDTAPIAVLKVQAEYADLGGGCANGNFLKGSQWSPDGACLLTASDDNRLRIFDLPADVLVSRGLGNATESTLGHVAAAADSAVAPVSVQEGELIYDYTWFPGMSVADPVTCCFASTCRAHPIHLWDACTGSLRCTYRAFDDKDECTASNSIAFSPDGTHIAAGANKVIRLFKTDVPGAKYLSRASFTKKAGGQPGIISCLAFNPDNSGIIAAGAYSGVAALYDAHTLAPATVMAGGHSAGITQVSWSPDGNYLYTGARQDPSILCWDVRSSGHFLYAMRRSCGTTNQRLAFSIESGGRHLASGGADGCVRVFDLVDGAERACFPVSHDTVNGCQYHPFLPMLATASGHRRFDSLVSDSDSEGEGEPLQGTQPPGPPDPSPELCNALVVWRLEAAWEGQQPAESSGTADTHRGRPATRGT
mmetsp:Transcript_4588/g.13196  ORF Transcript_4588/g.13196 Transcript_4588/m.13196 type:complete len:424 (-) Transcript_4588:321-1592(-)